MTNLEKKHELWNTLKTRYSHLENYCTIELPGIDEDNIYFHPIFIIDSETRITSQADIGNNNTIYATNFISSNFQIEVNESLISNIIIGYHTNKEAVILALDTLYKVREHMRKVERYTNEYITNILVGNSIKEITNAFINEIKTTSSVIEFMQKNKNK
jgi:hypothetical protein